MIFWGTFFPLISELFTGEKASLAAPWFDRYTTPLAILLVLFTGIGPLFAWRRVSLGAARRLLARPGAGRRWWSRRALLAFTDAGSQPLALVDVRARRLRARGAGPGVRARRRRLPVARRAARTRGRSSALFARNRRRYGGYVVHAGIAILLIAVAASSSFQTSRDLRLRPGQSATVDDYRITYEKPTAEISPRRAAADLRRGPHGDQGRQAATRPSTRRATTTPACGGPGRRAGGGPVRSFFEGEATSEVGRKTTVERRPVDRDAAPTSASLEPADQRRPTASSSRSAKGVSPKNMPGPAGARLPPGPGRPQRSSSSYLEDPPPANFRVNVNPLVTWIWVGGAIAVIGGLVAIWPAPEARRRRVSDVYAARLARELGRA